MGVKTGRAVGYTPLNELTIDRKPGRRINDSTLPTVRTSRRRANERLSFIRKRTQ